MIYKVAERKRGRMRSIPFRRGAGVNPDQYSPHPPPAGAPSPEGKAFVLDKRPESRYNEQANGVWRSLVSRLVRVQETSGSNPDTPTKKGKNAGISKSFRRFSYLSGCAWFLIDFTRTKRRDRYENKQKSPWLQGKPPMKPFSAFCRPKCSSNRSPPRHARRSMNAE